MKTITIIAFALMLSACGINTDTGTRALSASGFTNIKITGYAWIGCDKNDDFGSHFTATDVNGKSVTGSVCNGILKSTTIRID